MAVQELALGGLTASHFEPLIGQEFLLYPPADYPGWTGQPAALKLLSVRRFSGAVKAGGRQPFSLEFTGPGGPYDLPGCLHSLVHREFSLRDLFITRVMGNPVEFASTDSGHYECIFS